MVCAYGIDKSKYLFLEALDIIWMVFAYAINKTNVYLGGFQYSFDCIWLRDYQRMI